jgi:uncharacterized protein
MRPFFASFLDIHRFLSHPHHMSNSKHNTIDPELLAILRCPLTRSRLKQEGEYLVAEIGGLAYPVRDGIPVMLAEEAKLPPGVRSLEEFKARYTEQIP